MSLPRIPLSRRRLHGLLVVAALALAGAVGLYAVATDSEAGALLSSELPVGTSLATASNEEVVVATRKAVRKRPELAVSVVRVAIISKTPARAPRRPVETSKNVVDRFKDRVGSDKETPCPPCDFVVGVARSAILESTDLATNIVEAASDLCPSCASDLQALLNDPGLGIGFAGPSFNDPSDPFGYGVGLGPGFPGSAGLVSNPPPAGVISLPPIGVVVTQVTNQ